MTDHEKEEINKVKGFINEELTGILQITDSQEGLQKGQVLKRINMILDSYDEITPTLNKFFDEKHYREKWNREI